MARSSNTRSLRVWLNGIRVGIWSIGSSGIHEFSYEDSWLMHTQARPISLSIPLGKNQIRGEVVSSFFDNLLPDSTEIRQRIRTRYGAASISTIDLLAEIGRDCVGAIQLIPNDEKPSDQATVEGRPIDEHQIAEILKGMTSMGAGGRLSDDEFRISLAGAQEKTALLRFADQWLVPHGSTPSTHIIKLPLGRIGGLGLDMTNSVENEWLCLQIASAIGLNTASCEIQKFDDVTALVVERFDRRINTANKSIIRLPQEDFCQITATPSNGKYESDGGPGIDTVMSLLLGSADSKKDRETFFITQILFWLLAAPDGHAKNFSVFIERGGRYRLTPLYDIMSAYPVLGHGNGLIPPEKLKMAMAFRGKNRHYEWDKIYARHIYETGRRCGMDASIIDSMISNLVTDIPKAIESISRSLPNDFPASVADTIFEGMTKRISLLVAQ